MAKIILHTKINAPAERCFLLSLSVDLHKGSTAQTNEKAIAGVTSGLMKLNDTVTWEAKHLGVVQHFTTKITTYQKPNFFVSESICSIGSSIVKPVKSKSELPVVFLILPKIKFNSVGIKLN